MNLDNVSRVGQSTMKRLRARASVIWPNTGSTIVLRLAMSSFPFLLLSPLSQESCSLDLSGQRRRFRQPNHGSRPNDWRMSRRCRSWCRAGSDGWANDP